QIKSLSRPSFKMQIRATRLAIKLKSVQPIKQKILRPFSSDNRCSETELDERNIMVKPPMDTYSKILSKTVTEQVILCLIIPRWRMTPWFFISEISEINNHVDGYPVGRHPDIIKFIIAIRKTNHPPLHLDDTIDIFPSLDFIISFGSNDNMTILNLSQKTAFLIALG
ncbi:20874_t:CDS:2, partial [Gigaspora rosea]